jgi:hypothetical protein
MPIQEFAEGASAGLGRLLEMLVGGVEGHTPDAIAFGEEIKGDGVADRAQRHDRTSAEALAVARGDQTGLSRSGTSGNQKRP